MIRFVTLFVFLNWTNALLGQIKHFTDSKSLNNHLVLGGDTVVIDCDSVMAMNLNTFRSYEHSAGNKLELQILQDNYIAKQTDYGNTVKAELESQTERYKDLQSLMNSLLDRSKDFANLTKNGLTQITDSLDTVTHLLNDVKHEISESKKEIKKAKRIKALESFGWAGGGVLTGALITAVTFLVVRK
jgi:hypothetical protein